MFARIGDVLPRFRTYERLFSNHERLVEALSVAYLDIIMFCTNAKAVFRHGQRAPSRSSEAKEGSALLAQLLYYHICCTLIWL